MLASRSATEVLDVKVHCAFCSRRARLTLDKVSDIDKERKGIGRTDDTTDIRQDFWRLKVRVRLRRLIPMPGLSHLSSPTTHQFFLPTP